MNKATQEPKGLHQPMGFLDLLLFAIVTSFGLGMEAKAGQAGPAGITLWVLGGLVFLLPLALGVIVLAKEHPGKEGGLYLWSKEAFGPFAGFVTGWSYWVCIVPFLPSVLYLIAGSALSVGGDRWEYLGDEPVYFVLASLLCLAVATWLNLVGLEVGKWLHNLGPVGTWIPALLLIVLGLVALAVHGPVTPLTAANFIPEFGLHHASMWPILLFSLTGLEAASVLANEIKPDVLQRRLPLALGIAGTLGLLTKILATLAVLAVLLPPQLAGSTGFMEAFASAAKSVGASWLLPLVAALVVVGHVGNVGAWSATGARLPMMGGTDSLLPAAFGRVHRRWGTPYVALLFQSAVVAVLVVIGQLGTSTRGAYDVFLGIALFPTFVPFLFVFAAAIKVVWRDRGRGRRRATIALLILGLGTTAGSMTLAVIPPATEQNPGLYVAKIVGVAILLLGPGPLLYLGGKR